MRGFKLPECRPRAEQPQRTPTTSKKFRLSYEELEEVAAKTRINTDAAIQELRDELRRMNGQVVREDHVRAAYDTFSLDEAVLRKQLAEEYATSSSSSSE
jgi:hypothetical protein